MTSASKLCATVVLVLLILAAFCGAAIAAFDPSTVRYQDGKLTLNVRDAPVADLLKALAQKTGVRFVVDAEIKPGPITMTLEAMPLERAIRNLIGAMPQAAGHTMTYAPARNGVSRLVKVTLFGAGKMTASAGATVYGNDNPAPFAGGLPAGLPTPNLDERRDKMIAAGVPRETAEKVIGLTREVQKLQTTPRPGSYRPEDLNADSREKLQPLVDRGVPMERAVQMLLLQERYQETLKDLQKVPGGMPVVTPPTD